MQTLTIIQSCQPHQWEDNPMYCFEATSMRHNEVHWWDQWYTCTYIYHIGETFELIIYWVYWVSLESTASLTSITSHCFGLFNVDFQAVKWSIFHLHQNLIILSWMPIFQHFYTSFQMISCWNLWSKSLANHVFATNLNKSCHHGWSCNDRAPTAT